VKQPVSKQSGNGSGGLFKVAYSDAVRNALKELLKRAQEQGRIADVMAALKEINGRLHTDPTVFGEPFLNLKHLQGQMRHAVVGPLAVEFGVHPKSRHVFVVKPLVLSSVPGQNPP
jgi:hypothetical protein